MNAVILAGRIEVRVRISEETLLKTEPMADMEWHQQHPELSKPHISSVALQHSRVQRRG